MQFPFLFGPNILLSTLFSNTLSLCFSVMSQTKLHTHTKLYATFKLVYFHLYICWRWDDKTKIPNLRIKHLLYNSNKKNSSDYAMG
jgi:hypothetical protein